MTDVGGRHSSPEGPFPPRGDLGFGVPRYEPSRYEVPPYVTGGFGAVGRDTADTSRPAPRVLDRYDDQTGPLVEPDWWSYGSSDHPDHPLSARHSGGWDDDADLPSSHPSAPLPPRPAGVWDKLHARQDADGDDDRTVAQPLLPGSPLDTAAHREQTSGPVGGSHSSDDEDDDRHDDAATDAHLLDDSSWEDRTGGLEVIGAHVEEEPRGRRGRRGRRSGRHEAAGVDPADLDEDSLVHDEESGEVIPVKPYDRRTGRGRRRRNPVAIVLSLLVLAGLVVGIVLGGQKLIELVNPMAKDYTGQGSGDISIRVQDGDTLSDIGRTLVDADVIASVGPFVDAAEENAASVGIQPGVYSMRLQMSGRAALEQLLDPAARLLSRVTLPEGLTVERTLARIAEETGRPIEEFQAAAADTASLGLPAYANGQLEGFLFPATYDVEPDTTATDLLSQMVARGTEVLAGLGIPEADRLTVVTKASLVQAEAGSVEDMGKVARVLENRIADGMALQLDTTVNYANGKGGITTTPEDRANPSPYNTYLYPGLPPGAINNPGEDALRAVLAPTPGDWRFFVVVDPDTGDTRFAATKAEHDANVELFRQWLRENPEG
ncbi:endolytic transglycosylase MltG [Blastococcus litoris]|uniref:endolytic transglycosylase MltG n=1 Tax=Blastococcus litoris TaxID=2171622 RepID=UPI001F12EC9E|nr:endolytic transglycosylase MltG [Blastococcus litoris]